jgi:23S rRNA (adenine2503-C2)-methyltransferase
MLHDLLAVDSVTLRAIAGDLFQGRKGAGIAPAVHREAVRHGRFAPELLGIGPAAAMRWHQHFALALPALRRRLQESSPTGTIDKLVLAYADGSAVETVHLPMGRGRSSLCLSTQVGCARACTFCTTGRLGLVRNLTAGEITAQVTVARTLGLLPRTLVFMGMGEPLDNFDALDGALRVLTDRHGHGFAMERITVCTVGNVAGIRRLRQRGWKRLGLNLSLAAADDALRARLLPKAPAPLAQLKAALVDYRQRRNLTFGIHWCLLPGINDARADAAAVAAFCRGLGRVLVHVIPYNPGPAPVARPPTDAEVARFVGWLRDEGLPARRRLTKGGSVMAACGQLGASG